MPATMMARMPTKDSTIMATTTDLDGVLPFSTRLEEVPEETRLWKPERAPQATETNRTGNYHAGRQEKPVKTGAVIVA